jgi:topoisomerase-4 subunit B
VRNKKETIYCYSEEEKQAAISKLGSKPEITRFKGLGEISPDEFGGFIGENIRLQPVIIHKTIILKRYWSSIWAKIPPHARNLSSITCALNWM